MASTRTGGRAGGPGERDRKDRSEILHAGQIFSMGDVSMGIDPTQHGITRGETICFLDLAGNWNGESADGYEAYPGRPTVIRTPDELGKGHLLYRPRAQRPAHDGLTTVLTRRGHDLGVPLRLRAQRS